MDTTDPEQLERARLRSLVERDLDTAQLLHADDYQLITPGGRALSKQAYLELITSGDFVYETFEPASTIAVHARGSVFIARYQAHIVVRNASGERDAGRFWHTDVWERRDDGWQAVWSQATRIPDPDPAAPAREPVRLSSAELARRSHATPQRIVDLVDIGVLEPGPDGGFTPGDVQRVQIVAAFEQRGIELEHIARAIRDGRMSFELTDRIYPEASPPAGLTVGDLMSELGERGALLPDLFLALGRPKPDPDRPLTVDDEQVLRQFFDAWLTESFSTEAALRAARLLGDATRRLAEGSVDLFNREIRVTQDERDAMRMDELRPRILEPAVRVAGVFEPMTVWLLRHHLEQSLNAANIETLERALETEGLRPAADREPPAIVFADISGFTRLTEEHGDELAARHAESLAGLAAAAAAEHGGRLVKQLGDGVMLAFAGASGAVQAGVQLMRAAHAARLPELHVGISAGPVIERDGDYFGRTVNLASRMSELAGPGEALLNHAAAGAAGKPVAPLGPTTVKGLPEPVTLFRLELEPLTSG